MQTKNQTKIKDPSGVESTVGHVFVTGRRLAGRPFSFTITSGTPRCGLHVSFTVSSSVVILYIFLGDPFISGGGGGGGWVPRSFDCYP